VIVIIVPLNDTANEARLFVAGPRVTWPDVLYCDPWHGHVNVPPENPLTMHPWWVQITENAWKVSVAVRATRSFRAGVWTMAAVPTEPRGEPLSMAIWIWPPDSVADMVCKPDPPDPPDPFDGSPGLSHAWRTLAAMPLTAA
jgi:hypothetical protein